MLKHFIFTLLSVLITITQARDYCIKSSYISVWCEDGYSCCENSASYWCCKSIIRSCGSTTMSCQISITIIIIIIGCVVLIIGGCIGVVLYRRRKQQRKIINQQQQSQQQSAYAQPNQQAYAQPSNYQAYGVPMQQAPTYGTPIYGAPYGQQYPPIYNSPNQ